MRYYVTHMHGSWTDHMNMSQEEFDKFMERHKITREGPNPGIDVILFFTYEGDTVPEGLADALDACMKNFQVGDDLNKYDWKAMKRSIKRSQP